MIFFYKFLHLLLDLDYDKVDKKEGIRGAEDLQRSKKLVGLLQVLILLFAFSQRASPGRRTMAESARNFARYHAQFTAWLASIKMR